MNGTDCTGIEGQPSVRWELMDTKGKKIASSNKCKSLHIMIIWRSIVFMMVMMMVMMMMLMIINYGLRVFFNLADLAVY